MSLEHSPARQGKRAAYSLNEFCEDHRISRSMLYKLWAAGIGPRFMHVGTRVIITDEAAADWRRDREAATAKEEAAA
jgi:hypothetical protein